LDLEGPLLKTAKSGFDFVQSHCSFPTNKATELSKHSKGAKGLLVAIKKVEILDLSFLWVSSHWG